MTEDQSEPIQTVYLIHKFGKEDLSDVIFHVGERKFYCHKMFLAARSDYFATMFCSDFKEKNKKSVEVDADPIAFKHLMEIIYNGKTTDDWYLFFCDAHVKLRIENGDLNAKMWREIVALLTLADRFLLSGVVRDAVENALLRYHHRCPDVKENCYHCALKLVIAVRYDMKDYRKVSVSKTTAIKEVLWRTEMSFKDFAKLLERN